MSFSKYNILPSELRSHVLSYNDYKTLANYAPCSKLCNQEVQRTYIRVPFRIKLKEQEYTTNSDSSTTLTEVIVDIGYDEPKYQSYELKYRTVNGSKHIINADSTYKYEGDAHQAAIEYIKNLLKYSKKECDMMLTLDLAVWPTDLFEIPRIQKCRHWEIIVYESMYQGFYETISASPTPIVRLEMLTPNDNQEPFRIPAQFFESTSFQNLAHFDCWLPVPELSVDSFLTMKAEHIDITNTELPYTAINQKIAQWFANPPETKPRYFFDMIPDIARKASDERKMMAKSEMLKNLPVQPPEDLHLNRFSLRHQTGVKAFISFELGCASFKVDDESWSKWQQNKPSGSRPAKRK